MKKKKTIVITICLMAFCILGAMLKQRLENQTFEDTKSQCITRPWMIVQPIMPLGKPYNNNFSVLSYKFPPWWTPQLDDISYHQMPLVNSYHPINAKMVADGNHIWFTYSPSASLARYDIQTGQIKFYAIPDARNEPFWVSDIYLTKDGTLWVFLDSLQPGRGYSALARYHPDKDNFEIIADKDGLFASSKDSNWLVETNNVLAELPDGRLAIVMNGNINLYDPTVNQADLLVKDGNVISIATGDDNNIWYVNHYEDLNLRAVNTRTATVTNYGAPPQLRKNYEIQLELLEATKAITVDRSGSVWVSYFDKLEPDGTGKYSWHSLKLPPVFVNTFDPFYAYRWANVFSTHAFSDGNIWFASDIGIAKYDVQNATWCLSADVRSFAYYPITEDADGNLWTLIDNQIYKFQP